ncbi:MFS transporter [Janibacter limosus]|uniref:MFS transporter n=1 Tax=Janibacter limosus TaxID=53458 RepID=A0A4V0ZAP8_9MICO|nr:MFS transporter [Janibacter limosus]QBF45248.1 MFS transporter [Janibacter limosus]
MSPIRDDLSLLRERRFAALFAARTLSMLGLAFAPVALAFGVLGLPGADAGTLSLVVAAEAIPHVLGLLLGGVVADRYPRRFVMFAGECLSLVAWLGIGTMLLVGWAPIPMVCAFAVLTGLAGAVVWPVLSGIIPEVAPAGHLQPANALLAVGANVARIGGLIAAGAVVVLVGPGWALVGAAVIYAAAATFAWRIGSTPRPGREGGTSVVGELREGWVEFSSREWLWVVVAQFALLVLAWQGAHTVLGPVVAEAELGGAGAWSAILTGEAVGMLVGVVIALRIRPRRPILLGVVLTSLTALPYLLLGVGAPLPLIVLGGFVMGLGMDTFTVLWQTTMQREVPAEALSRVASYDAFGSMLFGPVGVLLAGPAAVHFGAHRALLGCAALILLSSLLALLSRDVRTLRAPERITPVPEGEFTPPVDPVV